MSPLGYPDYQTLYHQNINVQNNTFYNCTPVSLDIYDVSDNIFANNILLSDASNTFVNDLSTMYIFDENQRRMMISGNKLPTFDPSGNILCLNRSVGNTNKFKISGNMCFGGVVNVSDTNTGFLYVNSELQRNTTGYATITASSLAVGRGVDPNPPSFNINGITHDKLWNLDITGATRTLNDSGNNDIGCNQIATTGISINTPLTVSMVGPSYLH
jgi:hypothetical protein